MIDDIINTLDDFELTMFTYSTKWKNWIAILDFKTCLDCRRLHGKILGESEIIYEEPPIHERCRCEIKQLKAIYDGYATRNGQNGADYCLPPARSGSMMTVTTLCWIPYPGTVQLPAECL